MSTKDDASVKPTLGLPWNRVGNHVVDVGRRTVCVTYSSKREQSEAVLERSERAERIFRRVNAHDGLVAALQAFMALDRGFTEVCDRHLAEIAKESAMGRAVQLARAALSLAGEQA